MAYLLWISRQLPIGFYDYPHYGLHIGNGTRLLKWQWNLHVCILLDHWQCDLCFKNLYTQGKICLWWKVLPDPWVSTISRCFTIHNYQLTYDIVNFIHCLTLYWISDNVVYLLKTSLCWINLSMVESFTGSLRFCGAAACLQVRQWHLCCKLQSAEIGADNLEFICRLQLHAASIL